MLRNMIRDDMIEVNIDDDGNYIVTFDDGTTQSMDRAEYEQYLELLKVQKEAEAEEKWKTQEVDRLIAILEYVSEDVLPRSEREKYLNTMATKTPSGIRRARKQLEDKVCLNWICDEILDAGSYPTGKEDDPDGIVAFLVDNRIETVEEIISMTKDEFKAYYDYDVCVRDYRRLQALNHWYNNTEHENKGNLEVFLNLTRSDLLSYMVTAWHPTTEIGGAQTTTFVSAQTTTTVPIETGASIHDVIPAIAGPDSRRQSLLLARQ